MTPASKKGANKSAAGGKNAAGGGAGRKTEDWTAKAQLECDEFGKSGERDPLWWAAEAKTKVKAIEKLLNGMRQRCRNSGDINEVE